MARKRKNLDSIASEATPERRAALLLQRREAAVARIREYLKTKPGASAHLDEMTALWRAGYTLRQIGDRFGVTRQRIWQLIGHIKREVQR